MSIVVEISPGLQRSLSSLAALGGSTPVTSVLLSAANVVRNDAIPRAAYLTGTLRRSIRTEEIGRNDVAVGSDVPYARRIEFGFNGADSLGRRYHQAPRPYLRPAFDSTRNAQMREIETATRILLAQVLR